MDFYHASLHLFFVRARCLVSPLVSWCQKSSTQSYRGSHWAHPRASVIQTLGHCSYGCSVFALRARAFAKLCVSFGICWLSARACSSSEPKQASYAPLRSTPVWSSHWAGVLSARSAGALLSFARLGSMSLAFSETPLRSGSWTIGTIGSMPLCGSSSTTTPRAKACRATSRHCPPQWRPSRQEPGRATVWAGAGCQALGATPGTSQHHELPRPQRLGCRKHPLDWGEQCDCSQVATRLRTTHGT